MTGATTLGILYRLSLDAAQKQDSWTRRVIETGPGLLTTRVQLKKVTDPRGGFDRRVN